MQDIVYEQLLAQGQDLLESFCGDCQVFLRSVKSGTLRGGLVSLSLSAC